MKNDTHEISNVPFNADGFPDFSDYLYKGKTNEVIIRYSGNRVEDAKRANEAAGLARTPKGYVWHHHEDYGKMQLVEEIAHSKTGHTGGFEFSKAAVKAGRPFQGAIRAAEKVLDSHTMRALELFDPTTYLDAIMQSNTGYSIWDTDEDRWNKYCSSNPEKCS